MKRRFEPVDLMVAVGVFATIMGACVFFLGANGNLSGGVRETFSAPLSAVATAMQWIQPALGESIVEKEVLQRNAIHDMQQAAFQLLAAMAIADQLRGAGHAYLEGILTRAQFAEEEQAAQVQYVTGRMIANFTARGVRNNQLSAEAPDGPYNRHWIEMTQGMAQRMRSEFEQRRQSNLGEAIVSESSAHTSLQAQSQERLGIAIARVASVQDGYGEAFRAADAQGVAVMTAAFRTQALDGALTRLARAEPTQAEVPYVQPRTIPDVSVHLLIAASVTAIAIFLVGLMWRSGKEELTVAEREASTPPFRKTA